MGKFKLMLVIVFVSILVNVIVVFGKNLLSDYNNLYERPKRVINVLSDITEGIIKGDGSYVYSQVLMSPNAYHLAYYISDDGDRTNIELDINCNELPMIYSVLI